MTKTVLSTTFSILAWGSVGKFTTQAMQPAKVFLTAIVNTPVQSKISVSVSKAIFNKVSALHLRSGITELTKTEYGWVAGGASKLTKATTIVNQLPKNTHNYYLNNKLIKIWNNSLKEILHGHHSFPKFMGGHAKQKLTYMSKLEHIELHQDLLKFLKANYPEMMPKPGYSGLKIQANTLLSKRIQAMKEFYLGPGIKYTEAAKDFFKQI